MRAISSFIRDVGISARSCIALLALRMRVSMSAIGSVSTSRLLPGTLGHAGDRALVGELAEADPAESELAEDRARPAAAPAARVPADREPLRARLLDDEGLLGHSLPYLSVRSAANGSPSARSSASACSFVSAVVVIATSRPRI